MRRLLSPALLATLAVPALAEVPRPGSVLVFPIHDSATALTVLSITNTDISPGSFPGTDDIYVTLRYVNIVPNPDEPLKPLHCTSFHRSELLTPGDTVSFLTTCHNLPGQRGWVLAYARSFSGGPVSHNYLVGSGIVVNAQGSADGILPYSFQAIPPEGMPTDLDFDSKRDFDGVEYEPLPAALYADSFLGVGGTRLVLFNTATELSDIVQVRLDVTNDNEFPLSYTFPFKCWFERPLTQLDNIFTQGFLSLTPNDPSELDINCDNVDDLETGWFKIRALTASNGFQTIQNPAILGGLTGGPFALEPGRPLWGSGANLTGSI